MENIIFASVREMSQAVREKKVSSEEVVRAHLARIDGVNEQINALVQLDDAALEQARQADEALAKGQTMGPLHGVPFTVKDSIDTADVITTCGVPGRADFIPQKDATVVARLKAAGAILLGKTNLSMLCAEFESENPVYGLTNNPYDLARSAAGSSGGEAALIAAGGSPMGLGSDAGGSIRMPCHYCGIAGLKPTDGRIPTTGHFVPNWGAPNRGLIGPMARFVHDLAILLPILSGVDWSDSKVVPMPLGEPDAVKPGSLRVAFYTDNGLYTPTPETADVVHKAAVVLEDWGCEVKEDRPEAVSEAPEMFGNILPNLEVLRSILSELNENVVWDEQFAYDHVNTFLERAKELRSEDLRSEAEYYLWQVKLDLFRHRMLAFIEYYDVIVCPVSAKPALLHGFSKEKGKGHAENYTNPYNLAGWPAVVVRVGTSPEQLPIGIQVVARPWREDIALAVAEYLESHFGGWQRPEI